MYRLNLPEYQFTIKKQDNKFLIFDVQRKRYVALTPEEWVRQHFVRFLVDELGYPASLLSVETQINVNNLKKRCDVILFDKTATPSLIIELKAPNIPITQSVFDQVAVYNAKLNVSFFIISNGMKHYFCRVDTQNARYDILPSIPKYEEFLSIQP